MIGNKEDPRKVFGAAVTECALADERIVLLSADSGKSSGFGDFIRLAPQRYFEFGIMEQAVEGVASGLATTGKIPVFCAIAPFVTARPFEMFRNDIGYMRQNVKIVGRNGGITYSDLGSTHHSLDDFAIIRMIPGVRILCPQDPNEIRGAVKAMLAERGPIYMRIGNEPIENLFEEASFSIGKGRRIREGRDVTLVSTGSLTANAIAAAERLQAAGISVEHIGLPTIYPLYNYLLHQSLNKTGRVVTVEEHYVYGGIGTQIADLLASSFPAPVRKLGIPHAYASSGSYAEILRKYGLDAEGIAQSIAEFVNEGR